MRHERVDQLEKEIFLTGPTEFLVSRIAEQLALIPQFKKVFKDRIDPYRRMDYPIRGLPALRIYNDDYTKQFDSWFIEGDLTLDVIWPANLRRAEQQQFQDTLTAALLQQFRRPSFMSAVEESVPGLNELGKTFTVDKSLGFEWQDGTVPLTQITVNFRLDLRQWDEFLEQDGRTKEDPFERTLEDLERLFGTIPGLDDADAVQIETGADLKLED